MARTAATVHEQFVQLPFAVPPPINPVRADYLADNSRQTVTVLFIYTWKNYIYIYVCMCIISRARWLMVILLVISVLV